MSRQRGKRQKAYGHGRLAEKLCARVLRLKGYTVLETGFRTRVGEVDILASRGGKLIAVEVKTRATRAAAIESVSWRQRRRIERAAQWYMRGNSRWRRCGFRHILRTHGKPMSRIFGPADEM